METQPTINCSADTNELHPMLSLFSVSWNSENLFARRVTLIQNGRNWDLQILGRVRVGFSTQKHLLSWKVRSLSLAGAKTVYNTKKVLWTSRFYFFPAKKGLHCLLINAPSFLLKKTKMMLPRVVFFPIKWYRQLYKWGIKWSEIALVFAFLCSVIGPEKSRYHLSCNIETNPDFQYFRQFVSSFVWDRIGSLSYVHRSDWLFRLFCLWFKRWLLSDEVVTQTHTSSKSPFFSSMTEVDDVVLFE